MQEIRIERTKSPRQKPADSTKLGFGQIFTDHMFIMNYDEGQGWHGSADRALRSLSWIPPPCACTMARRF